MDEKHLRELVTISVRRPPAITETVDRQVRPTALPADRGRPMTVAVHHPAHGALRADNRLLAMADRAELLDGLVPALSRPAVSLTIDRKDHP